MYVDTTKTRFTIDPSDKPVSFSRQFTSRKDNFPFFSLQKKISYWDGIYLNNP